MDRIVLRQGDGTSQSTWLRSGVQHLQRALKTSGIAIDADGYFGSGTATIVKGFQAANGLVADGVVGPSAREALLPHHRARNEHLLQTIATEMPGFRGDLNWVHLREGHNGKPYWPGGASGVTLDPGIDLGHAKPEFVRSFQGVLFSADQWQQLEMVVGLKGEEAKNTLASIPALQAIRISSAAAEQVLPYAAKPYWEGIVSRFPSLADEHTLATVQTVLLSLSYNRGYGNKGLEVLSAPLSDGNWPEVASVVGNMQQDHSLEGIRNRRRWEAALIEAELAWPG